MGIDRRGGVRGLWLGQASQYPMEKAQTRMKPQTKKAEPGDRGAADPWSQPRFPIMRCPHPTPCSVVFGLSWSNLTNNRCEQAKTTFLNRRSVGMRTGSWSSSRRAPSLLAYYLLPGELSGKWTAHSMGSEESHDYQETWHLFLCHHTDAASLTEARTSLMS